MGPVPLAITVVCTQDWCPVGGRPARVYLRRVAPGVVEWPQLVCERCGCDMARKDDEVALQVCGQCTTRYAAGLDACPHCRSADAHEEGTDMPKITVHGGASNAREDPPVVAAPAPVAEVGPEPEVVEAATDPTPEPAFPESPFDASAVDVPAEQAAAAPEETESVAEVPVEAPAPKRRGRPRKAA